MFEIPMEAHYQDIRDQEHLDMLKSAFEDLEGHLCLETAFKELQGHVYSENVQHHRPVGFDVYRGPEDSVHVVPHQHLGTIVLRFDRYEHDEPLMISTTRDSGVEGVVHHLQAFGHNYVVYEEKQTSLGFPHD